MMWNAHWSGSGLYSRVAILLAEGRVHETPLPFGCDATVAEQTDRLHGSSPSGFGIGGDIYLEDDDGDLNAI